MLHYATDKQGRTGELRSNLSGFLTLRPRHSAGRLNVRWVGRNAIGEDLWELTQSRQPTTITEPFCLF